MVSSALFREALSKSTTVLQNSFTNLASNDRRKNDELDDLVEQLVQEADTGVQQGPFQRHHAGLQLCLHVWLSNDHVLQAEGEGILLQHVHEGEELIQEGVLQSHTSIKMRSNGPNPLARWEKGRQTLVSAYLSVNWRGCCHFNTEHAFVIIHPLHAWKLNLHHSEIHPI